MKIEKILGSIRLATIAKVCIILTLILVFVGAGIGITRTVQARQERNQLNAINNSLNEQGLTLQTKNLILRFAGLHQVQNVIVTDKDDNIVYSANKNIINKMTSFVLEPDQNVLGIFDLKGSSIKFVANPKSEVPFIQKNSDSQNSNYYFEGRNFNGGMMNGYMGAAKRQANGFGSNFRYGSQDRYEGQGKDGIRVVRIMGPGMLGANFAKGIPGGRPGISQNTLFLNSYKSEAKGFNIYYISKGFEQNNLMTVLFVTMNLIKLLVLVLFILLAIWVYRDSKARGLNAIFWGLFTLFTGLIGIIIYLIVKSRTNFCHVCGFKVGDQDNYCAICGASLKEKCERCGNDVKLDWNYCVNCGEKQKEKFEESEKDEAENEE